MYKNFNGSIVNCQSSIALPLYRKLNLVKQYFTVHDNEGFNDKLAFVMVHLT